MALEGAVGAVATPLQATVARQRLRTITCRMGSSFELRDVGSVLGRRSTSATQSSERASERLYRFEQRSRSSATASSLSPRRVVHASDHFPRNNRSGL